MSCICLDLRIDSTQNAIEYSSFMEKVSPNNYILFVVKGTALQYIGGLPQRNRVVVFLQIIANTQLKKKIAIQLLVKRHV